MNNLSRADCQRGAIVESSPEELELLRHYQQVLAASESFLDFVQLMNPAITLAPFQLDLIDKLDRLEKGQLTNEKGQTVRRLMINMPPRHGKSFLATTLFPIYYMGKKPTREIMSVSYNAELAKTFGRSVRDNLRDPVVQQAFPDIALSDESRAVDMWKTTENGVYYGVGMGGTTTGRGANLLLIDDPVKNRTEAESASSRNATWSYYVSALVNRKQPERDGTPPIEIIILTRWHPDDIAGRLMETDEWKNNEWMHVVYPALTTDKSGEQLALWPERFPVEDLLKLKKLNEREFTSLFQQSPYVEGGNLIKSTWFHYFAEREQSYESIILAADTAFKANTRSDYSVIMAAGITRTGDIHILDIYRDRLEYPQLKRALQTQYLRWRGKGLRGIYIEDKASGQSILQELRMAGLPVLAWGAKGFGNDKVARANSCTPLIEGGRVWLQAGAKWLEDFMTEVVAFPAVKHDDQVDAMTMAIDILSKHAIDNVDILNAPVEASGSLNQQMSKNPSTWKSALTSASEKTKGWGEL